MEILLNQMLLQVRHHESKLISELTPTSEEAYQMTLSLNEILKNIKSKVLQNGFKNEDQEIYFFKNLKPQILGKLIFYNKIFRIETNCPVSNGKIHQNYYENLLKNLKSEYKESICNEDFYSCFATSPI